MFALVVGGFDISVGSKLYRECYESMYSGLEQLKPGNTTANARKGTLGAACLDVFSAEPPDISAFADVPNLIATPHSAFYSQEAIRESQTKAVEAILDVLADREPRYRVI